MTNKNIPNKTIERYLRQELSAKELSDFTFQMVMNPSLRKEVEAMRTVFKSLKTTGPSPAISTINSGGNQRIMLAVGAMLLLAVAAFFYFQKGNTEAPMKPPVELILPTAPPANVPIAQAFIPNQFIEDAMLTRALSTSTFNVILKNENLQFSGNGLTQNGKAKVTVYNNQQADFIEERFVFAKTFTIAKDGKVELEFANPLSPGLYYFDMEISGEAVHLGSFEIKN